MSGVQAFKELHQQDDFLHIGNIWNAQSALLFERKGYQALGTSSAAIADSLGYEDGEQLSFDQLVTIVKSITETVSVPLTVDIEAGYSRDIDQIIRNIIRLTETGVVGINFEDSLVNSDSKRDIVDAGEFGKQVKTIKNGLNRQKIDCFLNVRTDCFLIGLDNAIEESMTRVKLYEEFGADGVFVPCVTSQEDIAKLVNCVSVPVNVMAMRGLPSFATLNELGVKRVSTGPFIYNKFKKVCNTYLDSVDKSGSFSSLFE